LFPYVAFNTSRVGSVVEEDEALVEVGAWVRTPLLDWKVDKGGESSHG
jgi:hypothetical protein